MEETEYIGYKYEYTGGLSGVFYYINNVEEKCHITFPVPVFPHTDGEKWRDILNIHGYGMVLSCTKDSQITIVPGISRFVKDAETHRDVFKIMVKDVRTFEQEIVFNRTDAYRIMVINNYYKMYFLKEKRQIACIERFEDMRMEVDPHNERLKSIFRAYIELREVSVEEILAILAFPFLRF